LKNNLKDNHYDVIIIGSGIGGSSIASIIAKKGYKVLNLEKNQHPRMTWGEATLPQLSFWMWLISERYNFPELKILADECKVTENISSSCGIKKSIGFAYHRQGKEHDMLNESHQILAPELPFQSETHYFREDIDHHMAKVSIENGVDLKENVEVTSFDQDDKGITISTKDGREFRGRYLIDSSGKQSIISKTYNLHDDPTRLKTQSRAIWNHFEGVEVFDNMFSKEELPGMKHMWHDGTLHHIFDGGWFWIIPFDNHKKSQNSLCSIGLMLDCRKYPKNETLSTEDEFKMFVDKFPTVKKQMKNARAVKNYLGTDRIQYSCKKAIGERYFITPQAYGGVDALYSRGMINTFESIYVFLDKILGALKENDFSPKRFEGMDELHRNQLDMHDLKVDTAYKSFGNFEAWSIWVKVWIASKLYGDIWLFRSIMKYMRNPDPKILTDLDFHKAPFIELFQKIVHLANDVFTKAEDGKMTWADATEQVTNTLAEADWLPHGQIPWAEIEKRHLDFTPELKLPSIILWGKTKAPKWVREEIFDFLPTPLIKMKIKEKLGMKIEV
jgi:FADH2 O2-dependent halogenase